MPDRTIGESGGSARGTRLVLGEERKAAVLPMMFAEEERTISMPADKSQNLQDVFLNHVRKQKVPVTVFLINGVKLQGVISSFDNFCLLLRRDGHIQLVYKHAVSTVMPATIVRLYEPPEEESSNG
jgi:host factor-I protein